MERWYIGYKCKKNPQEVINKISQIVQECNLSHKIPLLLMEKRARGDSWYYFFIAIQSKRIGELPAKISNSPLFQLPYFDSPVNTRPSPNIFTYYIPSNNGSIRNICYIKSMVGVAHQVEDYTHPIPYPVVEPDVIDDPFTLITQSSIDKQTTQSYQNLLYYLSAIGSGTWQSFKNVCKIFEITEPQRILRKLKLLGHLETSPDGKKWSIAPTSLVRISSQSIYVLCGQQTPRLIQELSKYGNVQNHQLRTTIELSNHTVEELITKVNETLRISIHNSGRVAEKLVEILPDLEIWKSRLSILQGIVPSFYQWRYFQNGTFIESGFPRETGMYQMLDQDNPDFIRSTVFYESETQTYRRGDWYGLRFLALRTSNQSLIVRYESNTKHFAVSYPQRWPEIYERVLVLASGKLPEFQKTEHNLWLIYENIELSLVNQITAKLGIIMEQTNYV